MPKRPEGADPYDWQNPTYAIDDNFQPYRPSDQTPSRAATSPGEFSDQLNADRYSMPADEDDEPADSTRSAKSSHTSGRWWTEDVKRPYRDGDRVRANKATGGTFVTHVPKGTQGRVTSTRHAVLGGEYATVEWDNGYTEEVITDHLERGREWWQ